MRVDFGGGDDIAFERRGAAGLVRITRARALNALTLGMVRALARALTAWADEADIACVVVEGEGRAFCAGGDLMALYRGREAGEPLHLFFEEEYRLNALIRRFPKPYAALLDGITMGGGVGISAHGSHRIVTENTLFAMPETGIGFFPDVGGSRILPHVPGRFGLYLALAGARIGPGDCMACGLATHAVASSDIPAIRERLAETGDVGAVLAAFDRAMERETSADTIRLVADCFCRPTLSAIIEALDRASKTGRQEAPPILKTLATRSPTSLAVTFRQMQEGVSLEMEDCLRMEYRILRRMLRGHDFFEGIRTVLVDKGDRPHWDPATLDEIRPELVASYFAPLGDAELELP